MLQCLLALPSFVEGVSDWCGQIDDALCDDKENKSSIQKYRLLRATRELAKVKMAGKQNEVKCVFYINIKFD